MLEGARELTRTLRQNTLSEERPGVFLIGLGEKKNNECTYDIHYGGASSNLSNSYYNNSTECK